jgi:hypothetical protein
LAIVGTESSSRGDYTKSEDDMVIERGVAAEPNALGYFGYAYYQAYQDQLKAVAVDSGKGCVLPSAGTVADGTYQPLSRPLFVYVNLAAAARPEVKAFAHFYLAPESAKYVKKVGYAALVTQAIRVCMPHERRRDERRAGPEYANSDCHKEGCRQHRPQRMMIAADEHLDGSRHDLRRSYDRS